MAIFVILILVVQFVSLVHRLDPETRVMISNLKKKKEPRNVTINVKVYTKSEYAINIFLD